MDKTVLVSIIVPVYNTSRWLRKCMDSICNQTYKNLQIIAIDDGSTDNSLSILHEYAALDSRVEVHHQENAGLSAARNTGLRHAKGEWITGCDSDDWLELNTVERIITALSTSDADIAIYGHNKINEELNSAQKNDALKNVKLSGVYKITEQLLKGMFSCCYFCNKYIRRSLIEELSLRFELGRCYEDVSFSLISLLSRMGQDVVILNEPLYNYRQHDSSILGKIRTQKTEKVLDVYKEVEKVLMYLQSKNELTNHQHFAISMLKYFEAIIRNNIPDTLLPEVEARTGKLLNQYGLDKEGLMYLYGIRSMPSIVRRLFIKINDLKITIKLFGIPLITHNRRNGMIRVALLGIPVYRSIPLPYKKLIVENNNNSSH